MLKFDALEAIDPRKVPLPNGTEVTTRVAQRFEGRQVASGAVGRVLRSDDNGLRGAAAAG